MSSKSEHFRKTIIRDGRCWPNHSMNQKAIKDMMERQAKMPRPNLSNVIILEPRNRQG